ncbi:MAG: UbiA family prenyltransferase [Actinomycetota bacterium]
MPDLETLARATRIRTGPMIVAPVAVGAALAYQRGFSFAWGWFLLTVVGAVALQAGSTVLNDVADARSGVDKLARVDRGAIATDPGLIEQHVLSARATVALAAALFGVALACGIAVAAARGAAVLWLGAVGAALGWQYGSPPLKYGYRALGDLGTFAAFGVLGVVGSYYVQAQRLDAAAVWASVVPGLFMMLVLFEHNLLHHRSDKGGGKITPVVLVGPETGLIVAGAALTATYVMLTLQVAFHLYPVWTLFAVLTAVPVARSWARAFQDPLPQNCLNLLGSTLGAGVLTCMTIALSLLFWR